MIENPTSNDDIPPSPFRNILTKASLAISGLFVVIANFFARPAQANVVLRITNQTTEEIKSLIESAEERGEYEAQETELIQSVFEFKETVAKEIMTPRTDLDAMPTDTNPFDLVELIQKSGHSRIPMYEGTDDDIVGIIHAKDLLIQMLRGKPVLLKSLMRPALFVTENKNIHELLSDMRLARTHLAVVKDEYGGTSGIVTVEDILEELVGEIQDEYDNEDPATIVTASGHHVEGKTNIDDVNEEIGSEFMSEDFDTIGGFVFGHFGRQPRQHEWIEIDGYLFTVLGTDGKRISKLAIEKLGPVNESEILDAQDASSASE
jgi:putative hemolysin